MDKYFKFRHGKATATLVVHSDKTATLKSVFSLDRGKGYANHLMKDVIDHADEHQLTLFLFVQRYGYIDKLSPTNDQLTEFYGKFGFEQVPADKKTIKMRRKALERGN